VRASECGRIRPTAGFVYQGASVIPAPVDAPLVHLDRIVFIELRDGEVAAIFLHRLRELRLCAIAADDQSSGSGKDESAKPPGHARYNGIGPVGL
jgi:hypothetical protein